MVPYLLFEIQQPSIEVSHESNSHCNSPNVKEESVKHKIVTKDFKHSIKAQTIRTSCDDSKLGLLGSLVRSWRRWRRFPSL